jgi:alpha-galactosidase
VYARDIVKWEVMKHFGAFVSESSVHMSEYVPYFRRTPELIERHTDERMWGVQPRGLSPDERRARWQTRRTEREEENRRLAYGTQDIRVARSHEYFSRILNAAETHTPYLFNGNVPNTGLIANLPAGPRDHPAVVEVPIVVDGCGLHPCYVGDLPPALAALNRSNLAVIELAVEGYLNKDRESIYRAVQLDPLTASLLSLAEIRQMVDQMFEAHAQYISF